MMDWTLGGMLWGWFLFCGITVNVLVGVAVTRIVWGAVSTMYKWFIKGE